MQHEARLVASVDLGSWGQPVELTTVGQGKVCLSNPEGVCMNDLIRAGRAFLDALDAWPASAADLVLDLASLPHTDELRREAELNLRGRMLVTVWELSDALDRMEQQQ